MTTYKLWCFLPEKYMCHGGMHFVELEEDGAGQVVVLQFRQKIGGEEEDALEGGTVAVFAREFLRETAVETGRELSIGEVVDALVELWMLAKRGRRGVPLDLTVRLLRGFLTEFDEQFARELQARGFPLI